MEIQNWEEITMDSDTFAQVRENFDMLLQRLFQKMQQNNSDEGSITLKIDVNMSDDYIPDESGTARRISKPILKHKITTTVPVKDSFDGKKDTGMELVYDEELGRYVLKYVSAGGQRSIFDADFQEVMNGNGEGDEIIDERALPMNSYLLEDTGVGEGENGDSSSNNVPDEEIQGGEDKNGAGGGTEKTDDDYEYEE